MPATARDPREIVTQDAFSVASELLGKPLARPWRRATAMAVDLIAVVIIGGLGWFFLGLAVAALLFRAALRPAAGVVRRGYRWATFGSLGALVLAGTLAGGWRTCSSGASGPSGLETAQTVLTGLGAAGSTVADVIALQRASTAEEAQVAARELALRLEGQGVEREEIREALAGLAAERDEPELREAILSGLRASEAGASSRDPDSLAIAYAAAIRAADSAGVASLREPLIESLAGERLARGRRQIDQLRSDNRQLQADLEQERDSGLISLLLNLADEVGIGFGWAGLYFTLFLTLWGGRTPGKRLLGIRVVRLDGKPIGLWAAFNRFGGYAASIFTGLLGFFEMLWDANRQALHDRIAATVVIRDRR